MNRPVFDGANGLRRRGYCGVCGFVMQGFGGAVGEGAVAGNVTGSFRSRLDGSARRVGSTGRLDGSARKGGSKRPAHGLVLGPS